MKKIEKIIWTVVFIVNTNSLWASGIVIDESAYNSIDPGDPGSDPGVTSINMFVIPMIIIGVFIAYYLFRNNYFSAEPTKKE